MLVFDILYRLPFVAVAYIIPCYSSYNAVVKDDKKRIQRWIGYWMVLSLCEVIFLFTDFFFQRNWIYLLLKLGFVFWISVPSKGGVDFISDVIITPIVNEHGETIDNGIAAITSKIFELLRLAKDKAISSIPALLHLTSQLPDAPPAKKDSSVC
ncbi:hypothetical protein WA556_000709 [Blastocystis sp. ATCC 50177/Nand II]